MCVPLSGTGDHAEITRAPSNPPGEAMNGAVSSHIVSSTKKAMERRHRNCAESIASRATLMVFEVTGEWVVD